jgi:hypothetical protein
MSAYSMNDDGTWSPAIHEPWWQGAGLRTAKCDCGKTFRKRRGFRYSRGLTREAYRDHYRSEHLGATR